MAILFADSFNSYLASTGLNAGGNVSSADNLVKAGYDQPYELPGSTRWAAGVFSANGKLNNGNSLRLCWQNANSNASLNYTPPAGSLALRRRFTNHWERFICLSTQIKLTKQYTQTVGLSKIPLIKLGPITVYVKLEYDTANNVQFYSLFANGSEQIGRMDSAQWTSLDLEVNREEKKLRVWLSNQVAWEASSEVFTTQSFEYVGWLAAPNADSATLVSHVGWCDLDSVVLQDGSGTNNNTRTVSLTAKTVAPDTPMETGFSYVGNGNQLTAISDTLTLNGTYDARYRLTQNTAGTRDLAKVATPGEINPLAVQIATVARGEQADSLPIRVATRFNSTLSFRKPQTHAGVWRQERVMFDEAPDGTKWTAAQIPNFEFGYEVADRSMITPIVNGGFEYLVFGAPGADLFDIYRGDVDPTYINPIKQEYMPPLEVIDPAGPGPKTLKAGTSRLGYFGTITTRELLYKASLADAVALTEGTAINTDTLWMKFINAGQIIFLPQKPLRNLVSWKALYQAGIVYGTDDAGPAGVSLPAGSLVNQKKIVDLGGSLFLVRLMTGANTNPTNAPYNSQDPVLAQQSEWSRLMHRIYENDPTGTFWERFTETDLDNPNNLSWCQEVHQYGAGYRVQRGYSQIPGLATSIGTAQNPTGSLVGAWRPALVWLGDGTPIPVDPYAMYTWAQMSFAEGIAIDDVSEAPLTLSNASIVANKLVNTNIDSAPLTNIPPVYFDAHEDFSIEGWFNFKSVAAYTGAILTMDMLGEGGEGNRTFMLSVNTNGKPYFMLSAGGRADTNSVALGWDAVPQVAALNTDNHIAVCRESGMLALYLNGILVQQVASALAAFRTTEFMSVRRGGIGKRWNMRVMRGKSAYKVGASITPLVSLPAVVIPTYEPALASDIMLQACFRRNSLVEEVSQNSITLSGGATVANGRVSALSAYTSTFSTLCPYFGAADFTIECKVRPSASTGYSGLLNQWNVTATAKANSWALFRDSSNYVYFLMRDTNDASYQFRTTASLVLNTDTHVVVERVAGVITIYFDGISVGSMQNDKALANIAGCLLRNNWDDASLIGNTKITNIRIAKRALFRGIVVVAPTFPKMPTHPSPGPASLKYGTEELGYYGSISTSQMVDGLDPGTIIGLSQGTPINSTCDWLKFAYKGKILFVPKMPQRSGLTWDSIYAAGAVYGEDGVGRLPGTPAVNQNRKVALGGQQFLVRLFKGADADPCPTSQYFVNNPEGTKNSEWTQLMQRVWESDPTATYWEKFTSAQMGIKSGSSSLGVWCQEEHVGWNPNCRVVRNHPDFLGLTTDYANALGANNLIESWWPVFEWDKKLDPPPLQTVTRIATAPRALANFSAGVGDGVLQIFGGQTVNGSNSQIYSRLDLETGVWSSSVNLGIWAWSGSVYANGFLWCPTGSDNAYKADMWKLNPLTGTGTKLSNIPDGARGQGRAAAINATTIHVAGGYSAATGKTVALHHKYDTVNNVWTRLADMPVSLNGHYAGCYNEKFYVGGGWNEVAGSTSDIREYDPATNSWRVLASAPVVSSWVAGCTFKNYFVLAAVQNGVIALHMYNIDNNTWTKTITTISQRWAFEMVSDANGVYVVGGVNSGNIGAGDYYTAARYSDVYKIT